MCSADGLPQLERSTTDGALARQNLDAQIDGHRGLVERRPDNLSARVLLTSLLLERTQYAGTFDDFDEAFVHADEALARHPEAGEAHVLRARVLTAVHEFDAALEALQTAEDLGAEVEDVRLTIQLARGERLDEVVAARRAQVEAYPTYGNHAAYAAALAAVGDYEKADAEYYAALESYQDVSPLPVAWVAFQRGVMWAEMADRAERGCALYTDGVTRLPTYTVATTHLAEIESEGALDTAISRVRSVLPHTSDPEPFGFLGELLLMEDPNHPEAPGLIAQAKARYDELLAKYPLAFADHGSEFFMGPGADPQRALSLAISNLENRRNDRAYSIAIEAALTAGDENLACDLAAEAGPDRPNVGLQDLVAEVLASCE
jgi:tetratricopeptide (TPR) repeat protein